MSELVERYVHQVGRYLPPKERAEIEVELRSQIQDQLDDRYVGTPSEAETAAVLAELGHPYMMAASYSGDKYLVGPLLYPYMMMVLRNVWLLVPVVVVFLNLFGALTSAQPPALFAFLVETVFAVLQATLIVSALVVLFFALIQHSYLKIESDDQPFNPLELPDVDDPTMVDRLEAAFGIAIGSVFTLILLYWLYVGGLTLRFNPGDPGEVIPVQAAWLVALVATIVAQVGLHLLALRRSRWSVGLWLTETVLEVFGMIGLYFVVLSPLFERISRDNPSWADRLGSAPEVIVVTLALITLTSRGVKLVRLWNYRQADVPAMPIRMVE